MGRVKGRRFIREKEKMDISQMPLMDDIEGEEPNGKGVESGIEEDFSYNNNVAGASKHIRLGFLRKVYGLLAIQLTITTIIGGVCLFTPGVKELVQANSWVMIPAFFLTAAVVIGLTAFTFQTKRDFSHMGAALYTGLLILILGGFMQIFLGNELTETAMAVGGALLFSLFIIYDTQMIMTRLSPEEYIFATIQLYLDIINLFIEILKILEKVNRK